MRIGVVSTLFHPVIGGTETLAKGICEGLHKLGHEIELITTKNKDRKDSDFDYNVINLEEVNFSNSDLFLNKNYDSVVLFTDLFTPAFVSIDTNQIKNSVLVLNLDENVYKWIKEGKINRHIVEKNIIKLKSFTNIISFCQAAPVNKFLDENKIDYTFIPNFSRDTLSSDKPAIDIRKLLNIPTDKKIIFNHGLIEARKNQFNLIDKFSKSKLKDDFVLVLLGSPRTNKEHKYLDKINSFVNKNNLNNCVKMIKGTTNTGLIDKLLCSSDVFILPSIAEGLPLVILEAMSAGLPWVSTPVGGVPKVFGELQGGIILDNIDFKPSDLEKTVINSLNTDTSRQEWENLFTREIAIQRYIKVLENVDINSRYISYLKNKKISFANQVYNEPKGIKNYLNSCLQFAEILDEVYVINHRSNDKTLQIIESFEDKYNKAGIKLKWKTEKRDFSKNFTIADLFGDAVRECENEIVFRHDADFIFSEGYLKTMYQSVRTLENSSVYACGYEIPVVSQELQFNNNTVSEHGPCKMHVSVPRVFKRTKTKCLQNHVNGKYEWFHPIDKECVEWKTIPFFKNSLLSINIKDSQRMLMRETMNTFMEDLQKGKVKGNWLDNKDLRKEKESQNNEDSNLRSISIVGEKYEF